MKLAVTQLAWTDPNDEAVLQTLAECGVTGIEVTPSKIWPGWEGCTPLKARDYAMSLWDRGFRVPAFQSILYGVEGAYLFRDDASWQKMRAHIRLVASLASEMGATVMVFGSPKNRDRGKMSPREAFDIGVRCFRELGRICADEGTRLCIEANPAEYGCNFINTTREAAALVEAVDHPGFGLHMDTAAMLFAEEDAAAVITENQGQICHFHASEPGLTGFGDPQADHQRAARALADTGYDRFVTIEMLASEEPIQSINEACRFIKAAYGSQLDRVRA
jgi:D-psicose/D-tagatose/L-ribulose 3-epimerase